MTPERLAEIAARAEAAHFGNSFEIDLADDLTDLLALVAEKDADLAAARAALGRVEALLTEWSSAIGQEYADDLRAALSDGGEA